MRPIVSLPPTRRRSAILRGLFLVPVLAWAWGPSPGAAQATAGTDPARPCPVACEGSLSCRLCTLKLELYRSWMEEVARGVELHPLPPEAISRLAPHLPGVPLEDVRVGYTAKQLADGLTDCDRIYLADREMADAVKRGDPLPPLQEELFLHELIHVEQCTRLGGRDAYALLWFRDVGMGALVLLLTGGDWMGLHGAMPMEAEAAERAATLLETLEREQVAGAGAFEPEERR